MQTHGYPYHPFANKFPPLNNAEFKEFVADIKAHGLREPITLYQGRILDGIHRYRACLRLKIEPQFVEFEGDDAAAHAFVLSRNVHRRHLKAKDKRKVIAALLKAMPELSDRQIAGIIKSSPTTVGTQREEMEKTGDVSKLDTRTDTNGRKQPAKKPAKPAKSGSKKTNSARVSAEAKQIEEELNQLRVPRADPVFLTNNRGVAAEPAVRDIAPDEELTLLREFALFVIGRTRVTTDPKDHAEWKTLLGKVKATRGITS
jgi:ParB-like chromosome segregation protein Spo0J